MHSVVCATAALPVSMSRSEAPLSVQIRQASRAGGTLPPVCLCLPGLPALIATRQVQPVVQ